MWAGHPDVSIIGKASHAFHVPVGDFILVESFPLLSGDSLP